MAQAQTAAPSPDETRQRTIRRLVIVLILIAVAIVALAFLDRASKKPVLPAESVVRPVLPPAPPTTTVPPANAPLTAQTPSVQPTNEPSPNEPPPPPAVLNNETLPPPAKHQEAPRKMDPAAAEDTHPGKTPESETTAPEKPGSAMTPLPQAVGKGSATAAPKAFVLQLGVFSSPDNAKAMQDRLAKAGIQSYTETRLQVGPFKDRTEADQARATLKGLGVKAVIIPQP